MIRSPHINIFGVIRTRALGCGIMELSSTNSKGCLTLSTGQCFFSKVKPLDMY